MVFSTGVINAGVHERDAAGGAVAYPFLGAPQDPPVPVAARAGFQCDRVGAVVGFSEGKSAEYLGAGQGAQPPVLLFGAAEQSEGAQRQTGLDRDNGAERSVAAGDFHIDQTGGERGNLREAGDVSRRR